MEELTYQRRGNSLNFQNVLNLQRRKAISYWVLVGNFEKRYLHVNVYHLVFFLYKKILQLSKWRRKDVVIDCDNHKKQAHTVRFFIELHKIQILSKLSMFALHCILVESKLMNSEWETQKWSLRNLGNKSLANLVKKSQNPSFIKEQICCEKNPNGGASQRQMALSSWLGLWSVFGSIGADS